MIEERRVIDAFSTSAIKCVALLDDAFDPPSVPDAQMGATLELLSAIEAGELAPGFVLAQVEIDAAQSLYVEERLGDAGKFKQRSRHGRGAKAVTPAMDAGKSQTPLIILSEAKPHRDESDLF